MDNIFGEDYPSILPFFKTHDAYTVYGVYIASNKNIQKCIELLQSNKVGLNHESFNIISTEIDEENMFLTNPYEITEGILQCDKCKNRKILYITRQTRSLDEPTTVFARCIKCNHSWKE